MADEPTPETAETEEITAEASAPGETGGSVTAPAGDEPAQTGGAPTGVAEAPTAEASSTSSAGPAGSQGAGPAASQGAGPDARPNRRKVREGLVLSVKMDSTAVIGVIERVRHPRYAKTVQRTKRLYAHDAANDLKIGDRVRVAETRPLSKLKRWRVVEVLERAK